MWAVKLIKVQIKTLTVSPTKKTIRPIGPSRVWLAVKPNRRLKVSNSKYRLAKMINRK